MKKCILACVAVLGLIGAARADDVTEYQAFAVFNQTGRAMTYEVRWGAGPWKAHTLAPGKGLIHSHPDYTDTPAPAPMVRFAARPGVTAAVRPHTSRVQEKRDAYRHFFRAEGGGNVTLSAR